MWGSHCEPSSWCFVRGRRLISRWRMDPGHGVAAGADGAVAQPGKGGILYCVVARGATVLARLSLVKILQVICAIYWTPPLVLHFTLWITGMLRVLETLRKSVTWCWQRLVWVSRWTNQSISILQGARTGTAQDDTDSRRVPVSLCLERWGGCVGHCRFANSHWKNPYCELYLSVSDSAYDRGEAFKFLGCVLDKFLRQFGERVHTAIAFAMNTEFSPVIAR